MVAMATMAGTTIMAATAARAQAVMRVAGTPVMTVTSKAARTAATDRFPLGRRRATPPGPAS